MPGALRVLVLFLAQIICICADSSAQIELRPPFFESSIRLSGLYYSDNESNRRFDESLQLALLLEDDLQFDLHTIYHDAEAENFEEDLTESWGVLSKKLDSAEFISAGLGVAVYEESQRPLGSLTYFRRKSDYFFLGEISHKPLVDTAAIISNRIRYTQLRVEGDYAVLSRVRPRIKAEYNEYTDDNGEVRVKLDLPYRFLTSPFDAQLGYRIEYASFRRQSGGGYFDPSELVSNQGFLSVSRWSETAWYYFEISAGQQNIERDDFKAEDTFVAFYSEMEFRLSRELSVGAYFEGGDYSLASASGFNYYQCIANIIWHFDDNNNAKAVGGSLTRN